MIIKEPLTNQVLNQSLETDFFLMKWVSETIREPFLLIERTKKSCRMLNDNLL